ncbi:MAG: hypothetical protein JW786_13190 [Desulfobacterales bacterium]|nr:hypothetical protein [Desulfobacterales bacterium]
MNIRSFPRQKQTQFLFLLSLLILLLGVLPVHAAITVPGADGSDGVLHITENTVIALSEAADGDWDTDNTANAGKGIYDPEKWAVVFKYSSVTVDEGAMLSFSNHPSRAPVVWLVSGDVTINGTVSLNGQSYQSAPANSEPGPGGFRGGSGTYTIDVTGGAGFGPGGGGRQYGGSYGTEGDGGPSRYGNQSLIPLVGGSGGGGNATYSAGGGAGGGAILIACQNTLAVNGLLRSNGGSGASNLIHGGGSGGGIRLIADTLTGSGTLNALAGGGSRSGGLGRIRIERVTNDNTLVVIPDPSLVNLATETTAVLWPPADAPSVKIVSIGSENSPDDPRASFGTFGADIVLPEPEVSTTQVVIETTNVEEASIVEVRVTPRFNASYTTVNATVDTISTNPLVIRWTADIPVAIGYSAVQVKVVRP